MSNSLSNEDKAFYLTRDYLNKMFEFGKADISDFIKIYKNIYKEVLNELNKPFVKTDSGYLGSFFKDF